MAKVSAVDRKSPNKRPAVWVQLGWGYVDLSQKGSFKTIQRKAEKKFFENSGVEETEKVIWV